ncbi:hypothetical protein BDV32DRAFT_140915 [Aspergillus pseudonomiae]|nr:hypothetical protein BDV32DRAFT_140915 [Aspergillus pseudonomiae]
MCQSDEASITRVGSDEQLNSLLLQPFEKPILWRKFTHYYPLHGIPSSISEFLKELRQLDIEFLEAYNYAEEDTNSEICLDNIVHHFEAPPGTRPPLNFLDIRNQILSRIPMHVNKVDLLRLTLRQQAGSAGKSKPLKVRLDYADHEFFLLSSRYSISPLHVDTAGQLTYIIGLSGFFTPEHSLTFGGNFYTLPHLGSSLRVLALQAKFNFVFSNEPITEQHYLNFCIMLDGCKDRMSDKQMSSVASSGIEWGITDQHQTREDVSNISWSGQAFSELQQMLRLLIWDIQTEGYAKFD